MMKNSLKGIGALILTALLAGFLTSCGSSGGGGGGGGGEGDDVIVNTEPTVSINTNANNNLVAFYPFSGNAQDASGNGHHGAVMGATLATDRFNDIESAYQFDGNGYISVSDSDDFTLGSNSFTMSAWVNMSELGADGGYYLMGHSEGPGDTNKWIFWLANSGISFIVGPNTGWIGLGTGTLQISSWHHVSISRLSNELTAYIDGVSIGTATLSISIPNPNASFLIGTAEHDRPNRVFRGRIDEVRIYSRALDIREIKALYNESDLFFYTTDSISLSGQANDAEDGVLSNTSLTWSSNIDGDLGTGNSISPALSEGKHTITLTATDSFGASSSSTLILTLETP